jgi:hypothetical protein
MKASTKYNLRSSISTMEQIYHIRHSYNTCTIIKVESSRSTAPSSTIKNHEGQSSTIKRHQKYYQVPLSTIKHDQTSSVIIAEVLSSIMNHEALLPTITHHQSPSTIKHHQIIIQHHQASSKHHSASSSPIKASFSHH